jgi:hypothetical protein
MVDFWSISRSRLWNSMNSENFRSDRSTTVGGVLLESSLDFFSSWRSRQNLAEMIRRSFFFFFSKLPISVTFLDHSWLDHEIPHILTIPDLGTTRSNPVFPGKRAVLSNCKRMNLQSRPPVQIISRMSNLERSASRQRNSCQCFSLFLELMMFWSDTGFGLGFKMFLI